MIKIKALIIGLLFISNIVHAAEKDSTNFSVVKIDNKKSSNKKRFFSLNIGSDLLNLNQKWKFHAGDSSIWANSGYNDAQWSLLKTNLDFDTISPKDFLGIAWFRMKIVLDSNLMRRPLAMVMQQQGASEIYLDGRLIHHFGKPSTDSLKEIRYNPHGVPISISSDTNKKEHLLAIRYSNHKAFSNYKNYNDGEQGFILAVTDMDTIVATQNKANLFVSAILMFLAGSLLSFGIFHLILFVFYHREKSNIYYGTFAISFGLISLAGFLFKNLPNPDICNQLNFFISYAFPIAFVSLQGLVYSFFKPRMPKIFWITLGISIISIGLAFYKYDVADILSAIASFVAIFESIRVLIVNGLKKLKRINHVKKLWKYVLVIFGALCLLAFLGVFISSLSFAKSIPIVLVGILALVFVIVILIGVFFIPVVMLVRHARSFSTTNKNLEVQLAHVKVLSAKTIEQEQEKQRILESQKEKLELQVKERTIELENKNKEITDSIAYARRIQQAILPSIEFIYETLQQSFIFYKPKDVVSGDFYAFAEKEGNVILAAIDCTGHGVPGAFMSMIGHDLLSQIIIEHGITKPAEILTELNIAVRKALKQDKNNTRDGMDAVIVSLDLINHKLQYAGANRPLYLVEKDAALQEIKATKCSIGGHTDANQQFEGHEFQLKKGDTFYLCSDGYADQFGGPEGKKMMTKQFKETLLSIQQIDMRAQETAIEKIFEEWKGNNDQVDDVLVMGVRL